MKKFPIVLLLAFTGILSMSCLAACGDEAGDTHTGGGGTSYVPNENSHLLKEGETVCEHCGKQLFEGELKFTLSDNQKYYEASNFYDVSGDVIVPDYFCSRGDDTYLPVLEIFADMGNNVKTLEISAVAEDVDFLEFDGNGLKEIRVAEGNAHYAAKDGVLYDKTLKNLLQYPRAKEDAAFVVPEGVTRIRESAFARNRELQRVEIASSVETFEEYSFVACESLSAIEFLHGSMLKTIGERAFWDCRKLQAIEIPASVETIGFCAFSHCEALETVGISEGSALQSIIGKAFYGCGSLQSIEIPAGVETIGEEAFYLCRRLERVEFAPDSALKTIGNRAFYWCDCLQSIEIPVSVVNMGESVFAYWDASQRIYVPFAKDTLPEGWSPLWSEEIADPSIIVYKGT